MRALLFFAFAPLLACGRDAPRVTASSAAPVTAATPSPAPAPASAALVAARPYAMRAPSPHAPHAPLLVLLHGYGSDHANVAGHFGVAALSDAHGVFVALPDGTPDARGARFWNATDACCDFGHVGVDDVAYLDAIVDDAVARYSVDPARVYVAGFSNGGFMAHRYACDRAARVAAVVSVAGDPWTDASKCRPEVPVSILQIHGDADTMVPYAGGPGRALPNGAARPPFPAARDALATWAAKDTCAATPERSDAALEEVLAWHGCAAGSEVQLWTRHGAPHVLEVTRDDGERVWSFLSAHHR